MKPNAQNGLAACFLAIIALLVVSARIDCGGTWSTLEGPGLTLDETFNVEQGVYLTVALSEYGPSVFTPSAAAEVFDRRQYNPDHPPLGRLLLGITHECVRAIAPAPDGGRITIAAGRVGSALALAATVLLVSWFLSSRVSRAAGVAGGLALVMMPRVLGHAHLGSLETFIGFFYTATLLALARAEDRSHRRPRRALLLTGVLLGLALLTKIQAIFLPVTIVVWLLVTERWAGLRSAAVVLVVGAVCFFALWPWLWLDPIAHLSEYLGRTTDRMTVYNHYFGTRYGAPPPDDSVPAVPWHYTLVMFLTTIPVGLHLLGFGGAWVAMRDRLRDWKGVILLGVAVPLVAFSVPGTPVYDGARLFLVVFPLWSILIGVAFESVWSRVKARAKAWPRAALVSVFALQSLGVLISGPFYLGYYNLLAGGTRGAAALGLETSYWGEGATESFWRSVPEGSTVYVAPVLDMYRLESLRKYVPVIQSRGIQLASFEYDLEAQPGLLVLLHRRADLPGWLHEWSLTREPIAQTTLQGVPLATLVENTGEQWPGQPSSR